MINSLGYTVFSLGASKVYQKTIFLQNGWILLTSEAFGGKTINPRELIVMLKVVYNFVSDNY